jgi:hypothetical protein
MSVFVIGFIAGCIAMAMALHFTGGGGDRR